MINVNISALSPQKLSPLWGDIAASHEHLQNKTGLGRDFLGWVKLPKEVDGSELSRLKDAAKRIREQSDILLVIGIGGSYLGARAVIEALGGSLYNLKQNGSPRVLFVGNNLSGSYVNDIIKLLEGKDFSINVISKSGTTTEPAVAFRIFKKIIEDRYGKQGARKRIYATTDKSRGALKELCDEEGYETFIIPDDIGGRYSVLTPVGLLPIAAAGISIDALLAGARDMMSVCAVPGADNPAWAYAAARNALYREGKQTEILATYDPDFMFLGEWYKQLYGESEGKENKGIFPAAVSFTADLHSMGQYIQEGVRNIFETVITVNNYDSEIIVDEDPANLDGLNFLAGKSLHEIEHKAFLGTYLAHSDGGVPNIIIQMTDKSERNIGALLYFFEYACGLSGYTLGVNPFDQPGVEAYKKNMFALLGKPGYEKEGEILSARANTVL